MAVTDLGPGIRPPVVLPSEADHPIRPPSWGRGLLSVALLVLAGIGVWTAAHGIAGVSWSEVGRVFHGLHLWQLGALSVLWLAGLAVHSVVLAAALPGLGMRRGLVLNLTGSAVANVLPLGGAVATALNWRMARLWGHTNVAFVSFCVLTNVLDVLTKLLLPVVAVLALLSFSISVPPVLLWISGICAVALVTATAMHLLTLRPVEQDGTGTPGRNRWATWRHQVALSLRRVQVLLQRQWLRLVPACLVYLAAQVALLYCCLLAVGLRAPLTVVLMTAAIERLASLFPITPGGAGTAELGAIAWMVAAGQPPVEAVAGVLLYRVFLVLMEIPVGGLVLGGWAWQRRLARRRPTVQEAG